MKPTLLIALFIAIGLHGDTTPATSLMGRYQVVPGEYFSGGFDFKTMIKVDSVTGQTWRLTRVATNGPLGWLEIDTLRKWEPK